MKKIIPFNQWYYKEEFRESDAGDSSLEGMTAVTVPHANKEIPFNYFDEGCYQFVSLSLIHIWDGTAPPPSSSLSWRNSWCMYLACPVLQYITGFWDRSSIRFRGPWPRLRCV